MIEYLKDQLIIARHELDAALGRQRRCDQDLLDLLRPALQAMDRGRHDVARERLDVAVEMLRKAVL